MARTDSTSPADDRAERMARLAEVLVDVDDRIAAEDAAAAKGQPRLTRECP